MEFALSLIRIIPAICLGRSSLLSEQHLKHLPALSHTILQSANMIGSLVADYLTI